MRTPLLFILAILTPVILCACLLLPAYGGILGAAYVIYMPASGPHPMAQHLLDVSTIIDTYGSLFDYWSRNSGKLSFVDYTLPIIGIPLLAGILGLWLTVYVARKLLNFFHLSATVH